MLTALFSLALAGCKPNKKAPQTDNTIPVKVISSNALHENEPVETSGLLSSEQQTNLSFISGGIIRQILIKEGDIVHKGQVLALLNMTEVNAQLNQAEENFSKTKRDAQRTANLFKDSVSTREQYENTQTAMAIAKKQLEVARFNMTQSSIRANADGVILKKLANEGELVNGGTPVLSLGGNAQRDWIIRCGLTDKDRSRITGKENAEIKFDISDQKFTGKVKSLAQGSDPATGLYQVEIRLDPSDIKLISGLFAKVRIYPPGKTDLLSLPMDALVEGKNDSAFVFTVSGNKAVRKTVKIAYLKGEKAFISAGLLPDDQVIRDGSAYLSNGSVIKIVK